MSVNADRLQWINRGQTCVVCGLSVTGRGLKSERFVEGGLTMTRHVTCRDGTPQPRDPFTVGTRVRLTAPMTVNGRLQGIGSVGDVGTVTEEYHANRATYPTITRVEFDGRHGYWADRECLDVIEPEDIEPMQEWERELLTTAQEADRLTEEINRLAEDRRTRRVIRLTFDEGTGEVTGTYVNPHHSTTQPRDSRGRFARPIRPGVRVRDNRLSMRRGDNAGEVIVIHGDGTARIEWDAGHTTGNTPLTWLEVIE
jgi:hypothetical protein